MTSFLEDYLREYLKFNDIDLYNYKNSDNYTKIKSKQLFLPSVGNISFDDLIERFLADKNQLLSHYESIYNMGHIHEIEINDEEYEDNCVALEIIQKLSIKPSKPTGKKLSFEEMEQIRADEEIEADEFVEKFTRPGGLIERLKTYLNFDLDNFDKESKRYKYERCKILYFFYMLEHIYFLKTNVLMLLSKPSMENIDNSSLGWKTYNGWIIKLIKASLEKELPRSAREIRNRITEIVTTWDAILENAYILMDFLYGNGYEYDFEKTIRPLSSIEKGVEKEEFVQYTDSPIETLYLKIVQHEFLGNVKDISKINSIQKNYDYSVPPEMIEEMKKLHYNKVDIKNIDLYIEQNALRISKYVYLKSNPSKYEKNKVYNSKKKIHKWLNFCFRAKPLLNIQDISNELQIISFLQAVILDDQRETFDYIFHDYQDHFKHKPQVQGALKNDNHVVDALQCYWSRKVTDRWYSNIGRYHMRMKAREFEKVCDDILEGILSKPSLNEMWETHNQYIDKVDDSLKTTNDQIQAVQNLVNFLGNAGFKYKDDSYLIRYAFLHSCDNACILTYLIMWIKDAINNYCPWLLVTIDALDADGKEPFTLEIEFDFDYQNGECILQKCELATDCYEQQNHL